MARLRNLTYCAPLHGRIEYKVIVPGRLEKVVNSTIRHIGDIPVMVNSTQCRLNNLKCTADFEATGECPNDLGGYFIIKGKERVSLKVLQYFLLLYLSLGCLNSY